jgi:hypothetical protein
VLFRSLLLRNDYGKGVLYVLTIPDAFGSLYDLPAEVLNPIRKTVAGRLPFRLEGPAQVGLFVYDNNAFIVQSFVSPGGAPVTVKVFTAGKGKFRDLATGKQVDGTWRQDGASLDVVLNPATYRVFKAE